MQKLHHLKSHHLCSHHVITFLMEPVLAWYVSKYTKKPSLSYSEGCNNTSDYKKRILSPPMACDVHISNCRKVSGHLNMCKCDHANLDWVIPVICYCIVSYRKSHPTKTLKISDLKPGGDKSWQGSHEEGYLSSDVDLFPVTTTWSRSV